MTRILVVDDDNIFRRFVHSTLTQHGYEVQEATGGIEAIQKCESTSFDLLIVDVVMPDKGGIETMMEAHALKQDLPIVMVSGKVPTSTDAFHRLVQNFGGREVLSKPFSAETLLATVHNALKTTPGPG